MLEVQGHQPSQSLGVRGHLWPHVITCDHLLPTPPKHSTNCSHAQEAATAVRQTKKVHHVGLNIATELCPRGSLPGAVTVLTAGVNHSQLCGCCAKAHTKHPQSMLLVLHPCASASLPAYAYDDYAQHDNLAICHRRSWNMSTIQTPGPGVGCCYSCRVIEVNLTTMHSPNSLLSLSPCIAAMHGSTLCVVPCKTGLQHNNKALWHIQQCMQACIAVLSRLVSLWQHHTV